MQHMNHVSSGAKTDQQVKTHSMDSMRPYCTWYKDNKTLHTVPRVTATHNVNSSLYTVHVYCIHHYIKSAYIKLKETLLNSVI